MACWNAYCNVNDADLTDSVGNSNFANNAVYVEYTDCNGVAQQNIFYAQGVNNLSTCLDDSYSYNVYYYQYNSQFFAYSNVVLDTDCGAETPTPTPTPTPPETPAVTPSQTSTPPSTPASTPSQTPSTTPNACYDYTLGPNSFSTTYQWTKCDGSGTASQFVGANTTYGPVCAASTPTGGFITKGAPCGTLPTPTSSETPTPTQTPSNTQTRTPTPTPVCTAPSLLSVTLVSGSLFTYNYGAPSNCTALTLSYSRDQVHGIMTHRHVLQEDKEILVMQQEHGILD